jgi:hypothetical protein
MSVYVKKLPFLALLISFTSHLLMSVYVKKLPFLALLMSFASLAHERLSEEAAFPCSMDLYG